MRYVRYFKLCISIQNAFWHTFRTDIIPRRCAVCKMTEMLQIRTCKLHCTRTRCTNSYTLLFNNRNEGFSGFIHVEKRIFMHLLTIMSYSHYIQITCITYCTVQSFACLDLYFYCVSSYFVLLPQQPKQELSCRKSNYYFHSIIIPTCKIFLFSRSIRLVLKSVHLSVYFFGIILCFIR